METDIAVVEEYRAPKTHSELKKMIETFLDLTASARTDAQLNRDYYNGKQLSAKTVKELRKRGQPEIFTNKIGPAINGMLGILDAAASDVEAFPRSYGSRDAADVATKILRYLADRADFKKVERECSDNFLVEGCCAAQVEWDGRHITVTRLRWEEFVFDPLSRDHDFSDAKWLGVAKLMDKSDVVAMFDTFDGSGTPEDIFSFDDNSKARFWGPLDRQFVRVVDLYYEIAGQWHRAIFTGSQVLFAGPSEYQDDEGASICPIAATSYDVTRDGDRYGPINNMRPLQDEVNARRSRLLHLTNHRQVRNTDQASPAANKAIAQREAAKSDGVIPFGYETIPAPDLAQGQMLILQQSTADLDRMAPTPAILGRISGSSESGRARQILQQAGYTELARPFSRFDAMKLGLYRAMWFCAKQYLSAPMEIRITNDPRTMEFMTINEPVMGIVAQPVIDPQTGQPAVDPTTGQPAVQVGTGVVGHRNRVAELDMDLVLSTVPDTVTLQQETFQAILEYASATGISPFSPEFAALLEISPIPNARETIEKVKAAMAEAGGNQQPDPMQIEAAKIGLEAQRAEIERHRAKAFRDITAAQAEQAASVRKGLGLCD